VEISAVVEAASSLVVDVTMAVVVVVVDIMLVAVIVATTAVATGVAVNLMGTQPPTTWSLCFSDSAPLQFMIKLAPVSTLSRLTLLSLFSVAVIL